MFIYRIEYVCDHHTFPQRTKIKAESITSAINEFASMAKNAKIEKYRITEIIETERRL